VNESRTALLLGREVAYVLKRSARRRTLALLVNENGLSVNAPMRASQKSVDELLQTHAAWTIKQLDKWLSLPRPETFRFQDGITLPFLGMPVTLNVVSGVVWSQPVLVSDTLRLAVADPLDEGAIRSRVEKWYRLHAQEYFFERVSHYATRMGLLATRLLLSNARTRWGSCNPEGEVRLSWRLMKAPPRVIDYVVVHELAHLKHLNHGKRFWALVEKHFPDWQAARRELHRDGHEYHLF
jgi:hypothetical protein